MTHLRLYITAGEPESQLSGQLRAVGYNPVGGWWCDEKLAEVFQWSVWAGRSKRVDGISTYNIRMLDLVIAARYGGYMTALRSGGDARGAGGEGGDDVAVVCLTLCRG